MWIPVVPRIKGIVTLAPDGTTARQSSLGPTLLRPGWNTVAALDVGSCDECNADNVAYQVTRSSKATVTSTKDVFSVHDGTDHIHDSTQRTDTYRCSNGHMWAIKFIIECPACGWTVDAHIAELMAQEGNKVTPT